jgi:DNA helicase-2/ATP-dependent DNA helicase PcrA
MDGEISPIQKQAIDALLGPVLVLSAAGTGKTKVLTHRIAKLIETGVEPENILAVTFTNKAAREMKERVQKLVGPPANKVWIGTFHSVCLRILRKHGRSIGYEPNFTIFDDHDQLSLLRKVIARLGYENTKEAGEFADIISKYKVKLLTTSDVLAAASDSKERMIANIYMEYQTEIMSNNALDFDDIIGQTIRLLESDMKVRAYYQEKFQYVLVDEYQDVNHAQYVLTRLLSQPQENIFVVGDDAQAIYGFRLADISNILNFEKDYPKATVIRLEQNYRSTANIIRAANSVINNNENQRPKALWTENPDGEPILLYQAGNDIDESRFVAASIRGLVDMGDSYDDCTILYRTSFQSRVLEDIFMRMRIPYVVVNGVSFYERKEVKDVMAYLKVISNPADSVALGRIINVPKRGIGDTTVEKLVMLAKDKGLTLFQALDYIGEIPRVSKAAKDGAASFKTLIDSLRKRSVRPDNGLVGFVEDVIRESGYFNMLYDNLRDAKGEDREQAQDRIGNIGELISIVKDFEEDQMDLSDFLQEMGLMTEVDRNDKDSADPKVRMMTVHAAKGLEFKNVFVVGLEEELFPHSMSIEEGNVEEERRLFYVAITRAIKRLFISHAKVRNIYGRNLQRLPSRFLDEIPPDVLMYEDGGSEWL